MSAEDRNDAPKTLLITGASRGIGAATARRAARDGWDVAVHYHRAEEPAIALVRELQTMGRRAVAMRGDVADPGAVAAVFDETEASLGPVGAVVVNAGMIAPSGPLAELEPERMRRVVDVNVLGALFTAREAARRMARSRGGFGGRLVIMSSAAARLGSPNEFVDYAASKGAMDTLTLGLAKELGPEGVRVNAVRPGLIETEIHVDAGWPERAAALGGQTPLGRAGSAEEVAELVVWLLSDAASYVSGALVDVGGGR